MQNIKVICSFEFQEDAKYCKTECQLDNFLTINILWFFHLYRTLTTYTYFTLVAENCATIFPVNLITWIANCILQERLYLNTFRLISSSFIYRMHEDMILLGTILHSSKSVNIATIGNEQE